MVPGNFCSIDAPRFVCSSTDHGFNGLSCVRRDRGPLKCRVPQSLRNCHSPAVIVRTRVCPPRDIVRKPRPTSWREDHSHLALSRCAMASFHPYHFRLLSFVPSFGHVRVRVGSGWKTNCSRQNSSDRSSARYKCLLLSIKFSHR